MFETIAYAAPAANTAAEQPSMWPSLIMMLVMVAVFWFILIRPQKKKEKELKNMLAALKVGDEIATVGGIHGKIIRIKDELFVIESGVGNNKSTMTVERGAVARFLKQAPENKEPEVIDAPEATEE